MNSSKLSLPLALAALALALTLTIRADNPAESTLRDHVDAQVPAHLAIESLNIRTIGTPAVKAKVELTLRAAENLYSETARQPDLKAVAAELTPDLRKQEPKALRVLKVVTAEGAVTKPLNFDFSVTATANGLALGKVDGKKFASFGQPRSEFAADCVAEDTLDGKAEIARWEKSVADYSQALKTHESRTRADRNKETAREVLNKGLQVLDRVKGGNGGAASGIGEVLGSVAGAPANTSTETNTAAPASANSKSQPKEKVADAVKRIGGLLGTFGTR